MKVNEAFKLIEICYKETLNITPKIFRSTGRDYHPKDSVHSIGFIQGTEYYPTRSSSNQCSEFSHFFINIGSKETTHPLLTIMGFVEDTEAPYNRSNWVFYKCPWST